MPIDQFSSRETAYSRYGLILVQQVLVFMTFALTLALLQYAFGAALSRSNLYVSVIIAVIYGYSRLCTGNLGCRCRVLVSSTCLFLVPFVSALAVSLFYFDTSCDGQHYHQEAVIQLAGGWNPLRDVFLAAPGFPDYINYFPKAAWILAATIYKGTGLIETGKTVNLLLIVATFFSVRAALEPMERLTSFARNIIAILLALNPVSVCQMFSFMVDGVLSSLILILISQFLILLREPVRLHYFVSGLSVVLLINVKYSGLPYALFLTCAYFACVLFQDRSLTRKASVFLGSAILIGVFAFGFNPYVTNTIETGNPFHRVIGQEATNTVDGHVEAGFLQKTRFEKFFLSVLSISMNSLHNPPELKIPLTISTGEVIPFFTPDTRIGGWGPLFGGALLLAAAIILQAAFRPPRYFRLALLATLLTFGAIFIFPEPWWARYAPHAWILPFIPVVMSYYTYGAFVGILRRAVLTVLCVNILFVTAISAGAETWASLYLHRHLSILACMSEEEPLPATFQLYYSNRVRLQESGVRFYEAGQAACENPAFFDRVGRTLSDTATLICVDREEYRRLEGRLLPDLRRLRGYLVRKVLEGGATTDGTPLILSSGG